jgi:lipocalin
MKRLALVCYGLLALACSPTTTARLRLPPLETVAQVDLQRYLGTWYEIGSFLWILSRTPTMDDQRYASIVRRLSLLGYETERLRVTLQPASAPLTANDSSGQQAKMRLTEGYTTDEGLVDAK